ncbi:ion channel [Penicillium brasilianum]|uniref:Ion channel n=1 Tax=Penicillium brasilianum TaxID=104259 RepID=A0A1S9RVF9_PENBI|nr:ion channel [Penicillium brasilianum]
MQNEFPPLAAAANATTQKLSRWERFSNRFHMRPPEDDEPQSWWIASTAIPLVAAAAGPLANVMSIVALVQPWRNTIISRETGPGGIWIEEGYNDPKWVTAMNAISLFCGVVGNMFLLLNFTQTVRYIIALPVTIVSWFLATGILCGLTVSLFIYNPPIPPNEVYSQAYWSAVIAASLYFILAFFLMINMLGYFLGKYPQHFALTDDQRTLILQMTGFVVWLLIGAAIFQRVLGISFADALYFCDVTVLTLGFGDVTPQTAVGKGLIWPYAVVGIIMLGLVVGSIHQFAREVHYDNVVRKHIEHKRRATFNRSVTFEQLRDAGEPLEKDIVIPKQASHRSKAHHNRQHRHYRHRPIHDALVAGRRPRLLVMREEKDRFDAMRAIQYETMRFRRWNDLIISIIVYNIVWTGGAVVFWRLEDISYFDGLYFCFCSLITIGYGDITPQSNAGRPFFVMWSLIAIPTMTMLISQMSDTIVAGYKHSTERFSDYFVMPRQGAYKGIFARIPLLRRWIQIRQEKQRLRRGFEVGAEADEAAETNNRASPASNPQGMPPVVLPHHRSGDGHPQRTLEELARDANPSPFELAQQLSFAIRRTTHDAREGKRKRYTYEEWVEFTRLIQFTDPNSRPSLHADRNHPFQTSTGVDEDEYGVLNWDWIGENSPMLAHQSEPEWILDRLCESLCRYVSTQEHARAASQGHNDDAAEAPTLKKERDLGIEEA